MCVHYSSTLNHISKFPPLSYIYLKELVIIITLYFNYRLLVSKIEVYMQNFQGKILSINT